MNQTKYMTSAGFSMREASESDLESIIAVETRVQKSPWTETHFREELSKPFSRVLLITDDETDAKTAAYIVYWCLLDECQILNIGVDLPFRGLGFAKQLVRKAADEALKKGFKFVNLDVRKSNQPAIQLYQAAGFNISAIRKGFYSDGEDGYFMTLGLNEDGLKF